MTEDLRPVYFGCAPGARPGHRLCRRGPRTRGCQPSDYGLPWGWEIDSKLAPRPEVEFHGALHHKDGWSAVSWWDRRGDSRSNSNSAVFIPEPDLTFDEVIERGRAEFGRRVPETVIDRTHPEGGE